VFHFIGQRRKIMRAVVQRVTRSSVTVDGVTTGEIEGGLNVLLGVSAEDTEADAEYMAEKIANLRIFEDEDGKMNRSIIDAGGSMLCISQFTLYGDCRKGRRPSFIEAAQPDRAVVLYEHFMSEVRRLGIEVASGVFRAHMKVSIENDGPVTLIIDSQKNF
jgi:D-tyrosyl-tRNA(Tyr) deacylase